MKKNRLIGFASSIIAFAFTMPSASAVTYYFDADGNATAATGGNGTWDTTSSLWRNGNSTGTLSAWANGSPNSDTANLAGNATLTLNSSNATINVNKIVIGGNSTTVGAPASGTATLGLSGTTPTIDTGVFTGSITAGITGSAGLTKIGTGTLNLTNAANSFSGDVSVQNGTIGITTSLGNSGSASVLGTGSLIKLGATTTTGTIKVSPGGNFTSDKTINLAGTTGGGTISMAPTVSSASLTLSGNITAAAGGAKTMNFSTSGTNTANFIVNSLITNATDNSTVTVRMNGSGNGALTLTNNSSTYSGGVTIDGNINSKTYEVSTAAVGNTGSASPLGTGSTIRMGTTSAATPTNRLTYTGAGEVTNKVIDLYGVGGTASIYNSGSGTLKFTSNFTASGAATHQLNVDGPAGGTVEIAGAIVDNSVANTTSIKKGGNGVLVLSGSNTYTGVTNVNQGTLQFATGSLNTTSSIQFTSTGTLQWADGNTQDLSSRITMVSSAYARIDTNGNNVTFASSIGSSTSGILNKIGNGTLNLTAVNTYGGGTTVEAGTVKFSSGALGSSGQIRVTGGALQWASGNTDDISSRFSLTANSTGTLDTNGNNISFANALTSTVPTGNQTGAGFIKAGSGTLTLNGTSTYTGATLISGGTLALTSNGSIATSSELSLGTVGTFDVTNKSGSYAVNTLKGSGEVKGNLIISNTLAIGNSPGTINFSGDLALAAGSHFTYEVTSGTSPGLGSADLASVTGSLTISSTASFDLVQLGTYTAGNKFTLFAYNGSLTGNFSGLVDGANFTVGGGEWVIDYNDATAGLNGGTSTSNTFVTITAVPEPSIVSMILVVGAGLVLRRRRI
ncbi:MAG: autotransporter-associated beta strand repeat-containing protein [Akkermansiaceae bacterium]|nr:autotransporter-associated beta strand repeat-containing protein [Akkermansiaceae bacterium]